MNRVKSGLLLHKRDDGGPPPPDRVTVGCVVWKSVEDNELLRRWRSLINALTHPDGVRAIGIAVHDQQRRLASSDGCDVVPLIWKHACHPPGNTPGMDGAFASGRKCAADNQTCRCWPEFGIRVEENSTPHGKTKSAHAASCCEARMKKGVGC